MSSTSPRSNEDRQAVLALDEVFPLGGAREFAEIQNLDRALAEQVIFAAQIGDSLIDDAAEFRGPQDHRRFEAADHVGEDRRLAGAGDGLELADEGNRPAAEDVRTVGKIGNGGVDQPAVAASC